MARPRIGDVAERAGVSKTAVSFAYNQPEHLNTTTRARILAAADELGYRPSPIARRLARRRTQQIGPKSEKGGKGESRGGERE